MDAAILGPGEGETVTDRASHFVQIKADLPQLAVTLSRYSDGQAGPGPHVHREHADCFLVLDGELAFEVGPELERVAVGAGGFVLVPPNVVHTFRNESGADARFLNVHAPNAGFADHLRAMSAGADEGSTGFDSHDPPDDGGRPAADAIVRRDGEGDELRMGPIRSLMRASAEDDAGWVAVMETALAPGFPGPVAHRHRAMADSFLVLEGTLTLRAGDELRSAPAGSWATFPPGTVHTFSNPGAEPVRVLNVMTPAGLEGYLREVAVEASSGPPDPQRMAEIASRYDFEPAE